MKLIVDKSVREKYPDLRIAIVAAKILDSERSEKLEEKIESTYNDFCEKVGTLDEFLNSKNVLEWRETYRSFGINPKKKKPSAEAFLGRVIKNNYRPRINPAVDSYLMSEALYSLPIGGYDLDKIDGDILLTISNGNEEFIPIGNDDSEVTKENEVIYKDDKRILTRCWNYRDCMYSQITDSSKNIVLFVEAPSLKISDEEILETIKDVEKNLVDFCSANTEIFYLDSKSNEITICE